MTKSHTVMMQNYTVQTNMWPSLMTVLPETFQNLKPECLVHCVFPEKQIHNGLFS